MKFPVNDLESSSIVSENILHLVQVHFYLVVAVLTSAIGYTMLNMPLTLCVNMRAFQSYESVNFKKMIIMMNGQG